MKDNSPESIKKYIENMVEKLNEKHPNAIKEEEVQAIVDTFTKQANSETLKDDISKYFEDRVAALGAPDAKKEVEEAAKLSDELLNRTDKTFAEIKFSYEQFMKIMKQSGLKAYLYGALSSYIISGQAPVRNFDSIDLACKMKDVQKIRQALIEAGYYDERGDSITKGDAGDYGFEFVFAGVPINIKPFRYEDGIVTQYSYDSKTQTGVTIKQEAEDKEEYTMSCRGHDGEIYDVINMKFLNERGEMTTSQIGNSEDVKTDELNEEGLGDEVYDELSEAEEKALEEAAVKGEEPPFSPMTPAEQMAYEKIKEKNLEKSKERENAVVRQRTKEQHSSGHIDTSLILVSVMLLGVIVVAICYLILR